MLLKPSILFFALSHLFFSQIQAQHNPTVFDKFIKKPKIIWASYANDTLNLDGYNLSDKLINGFKNRKLKISFPLNRDSLLKYKKISYINKNDFEQRTFPNGRIDSISAKKINVEEIFYVTNGKLYSYVPWVSPKISVYTSQDQFLGFSELFSSSINYNYKFTSSKRDKTIFITTTKRRFAVDNFPRADRLKELYGVSMLEAIWSDLMNDKNEIIEMNSGQKIFFKNLQNYHFSDIVNVPIYDSLGQVTGTRKYSQAITPSLFPQIEITQNWFYDQTKNIVTNNISDITLFIRSEYYLTKVKLLPLLKITFK